MYMGGKLVVIPFMSEVPFWWLHEGVQHTEVYNLNRCPG